MQTLGTALTMKKIAIITRGEHRDDVMLCVFVGEHSLVVENVIDEDVVTGILLVRLVVVVLQNLAALVDDALVKSFQEIALSLVLVVAWRQLEDGVRVHDWLILQQSRRLGCAANDFEVERLSS